MKKCERCGKDLETTKILSAIKCFGRTLCQSCFFSIVREGNNRRAPFLNIPLKLPIGEKEKTHERRSLRELAAELKVERFTGHLEVHIPDYGLTSGGEGRVLFVVGEIIAASFETDERTMSRSEALETMFNYPSIKTHGKIEQYSYGDTDVWLSIEINKNQLFEFESFEREQTPISNEVFEEAADGDLIQ